MKFSFNFKSRPRLACATALALFAAGCRPPAPAAPSAVASDGGSGQRVVALLDYVAGDYRGAVRDGVVTSEDEFQEQLHFVGDAGRMAASVVPAGDPLLQHISDVERAVRAKASADEVEVAARRARDEAVARFGLPTTPAGQPSLPHAQALYAQNCVPCHGPKGDGRGPSAATLSAKPRNFTDPEVRAELSAYRVYNTLTFGVAGTPMASFATLRPEERWELAFYVLRLGHADLPARGPVALGLGDLSARNDTELLGALAKAGVPEPEKALAWARTEAPFEPRPPSEGLARARELLQESSRAYAAGRSEDADGLAIDAYLQGFEPQEATLRARDAAGTAAVEREFHELRAAIARHDDVVVKARVTGLDERIAALSGAPRRAGVPALAAFLIFFREGIEAALLVGAMLAGVRRLGRAEAAASIHRGWIAALPAGVATWWLFERVLQWGSAQRELMEACVALLAAAVLFSMSFWMISKAESKRWMAYLHGHLEQSITRQNLLVLTGVAFLAVYREAAETVLFTQALLLESPGSATQVWGGALAGLAGVIVLAAALQGAVRRLPLAPFFAVSSALLCALAISFAGSGIYALVSAGVLRARPVAFPEVPWMGIHPDLTGLLVQLVIVTVIGAAAVVTFRGAKDSAEP